METAAAAAVHPSPHHQHQPHHLHQPPPPPHQPQGPPPPPQVPAPRLAPLPPPPQAPKKAPKSINDAAAETVAASASGRVAARALLAKLAPGEATGANGLPPEHSTTPPLHLKGVGSTSTWTLEEDQRLFTLVNDHGAQSWSVIAAKFPGRVGKQCRER